MAGTVAHIDFETRSAVDLKKAGVYRYAEDPSTSIICLSYRLGDGPVRRWRPGEPFPIDLELHLNGGGHVAAHNAGFERTIWNALMPGPFKLEIERQDCTLARGVAVGLPARLEDLGRVLGAPIQKDKDGHRLMLKMCKPRKVHDDGRIEWWDSPDDLERLQAYCDQDVEAECGIDRRVPHLSSSERRLWVLDQQVNDRGVRVEVSDVQNALDVVGEARRRADREIWRLTNGSVTKCSQVKKIVDWINARGMPCESVAKGEVEDLLIKSDLFDDALVAEVVNLRRAAARSSTAKYEAILNTVCHDGRVRGTLAYHGAHTGRWAGRLIQPQNFPRVDDPAIVEAALEVLQGSGTPAQKCDLIECICGPAMEVLSKCLRAMIVAPEGKRLIGGDFSNIEGRVNAWFAGEQWKLDAFRDYDAGTGPDLYRLAYGRSFGLEPDAVDAAGRQIGKVMELALGYQGGVGAFQTMAAVYGVRVTDARADALKRAWRDANPAITASWWDLQDAAIAAVSSKGLVVPCLQGKVRYVSDGKFLYCRLPSGRVIHYASPVVRWRKREIVQPDGTTTVLESRGVSYWGNDQGRWSLIDLYGGSQCDHVVQGTARDLLVEAMFRVEAAGYPIVLTVHDEILCEVDQDFGDVDEFEALMSELPAWAEGLPVATKAWEDVRYTK